MTRLVIFQAVIRVEMRTEIHESVRKHKTTELKCGKVYVEEVIERRTTTAPFALLSCGHWRKASSSGADIRTAKRLACWVCERTTDSGAEALV